MICDKLINTNARLQEESDSGLHSHYYANIRTFLF